jgi:hypothetical protein
MAISMETLLLFLFAILDIVSARADPWALPTPYAFNKHMLNERAPAPTAAPRMRGPLGAVSPNQLFGRELAYTCGYSEQEPGDWLSTYALTNWEQSTAMVLNRTLARKAMSAPSMATIGNAVYGHR